MSALKLNNQQIGILKYLQTEPNGAKVQKIARHTNLHTTDVVRIIRVKPMSPDLCFEDEEGRWHCNYTMQEINAMLNPPRAPKIDVTPAASVTLDSSAQKAFDYVNSGQSVFITGKAGTGKTFLLKQIVQAYKGKKVVAVLAPTGVAAENAGGYTMHSFLRLPLTVYIPGYKKNDLYNVDYSSEDVLRSLDMIIIDEISMVRCDILDAADDILRHYRKSDFPFGGVQLVMFGDLFQLMPVAQAEEWDTLKEHYDSPYFFSSKVLESLPYKVVELTHNYRQETDQPFINLLNHIREAKIKKKDISFLNTRYVPNNDEPDEVVRLMTHNFQTKQYNNDKMLQLETRENTYKASAKDWFEKRPVDYNLQLKVGARVMFVRNDSNGRFVNGTMGWVKELGYDYIVVRKDNGVSIRVTPYKWIRYEYEVDKTTKAIRSYEAGYFIQLPVKLAWAVTIHKSQGLTFDRVVINAEKAFTYGQIYVALSRCRTFDGITLLSEIHSQSIVVDDYVKAYMDAIDAEGNVAPLSMPGGDYEEDHLYMWVTAKKLYKIKNGNLRLYSRKVDDMLQWRIFQHDEDGELVVNDTYKDKRRKWKYDDYNGGNFPFVLYKYRTIQFRAEYSPLRVTCELLSMDVYFADDTYPDSWAIKCRLGKIISIEN